MKKLSLNDLISDIPTYIQHAKAGDLFIYPTDTIYGIGAIVTPESIQKINQAKQRLPGKHYSIIAPSFEWIQQYFDVKETFEEERKDRQIQFPSRGLTLLLPYTDSPLDKGGTGGICRTDFSLLSSTSTIGVRLLTHPFQDFVTALGQPFITTSCNISGTQPITSIDQIPEELKNHVDYVIDGGELEGKASVVIDYVSGEIIRV